MASHEKIIILAVDAEYNGVSKGRLALRLQWSFVMAVFVKSVLLSAVVFQQGGRPFKKSVIRACFCLFLCFVLFFSTRVLSEQGWSFKREGGLP